VLRRRWGPPRLGVCVVHTQVFAGHTPWLGCAAKEAWSGAVHGALGVAGPSGGEACGAPRRATAWPDGSKPSCLDPLSRISPRPPACHAPRPLPHLPPPKPFPPPPT
jgi:hypothetical protein